MALIREDIPMDKRVRHKPRYNVISMRISEEERKRLDDIAARNNMNVSDMMRIAFENYTTTSH
jgi:antitoxin component of RelBE/YafQ-DinJ toxin-antitoxin module